MRRVPASTSTVRSNCRESYNTEEANGSESLQDIEIKSRFHTNNPEEDV